GAGADRTPLQAPRWERQLALGFVNLTPSVRLRALVEDWPLHRIQEAVQAQRLETLRAHERYPTGIGPDRGASLASQRPGCSGLLAWLAACGLAAGIVAGLIGGLR